MRFPTKKRWVPENKEMNLPIPKTFGSDYVPEEISEYLGEFSDAFHHWHQRAERPESYAEAEH